MATLTVEGDDVVLQLSRLEKLGAFHGDVRVARSAIRSVRQVANTFAEVKGMRAPGTGMPRLVALGTWRRGKGRKEFVAAYRNRPGLVIELDPEQAPFERLIVSTIDDGAGLMPSPPPAPPRSPPEP